MFTQIDPRLSSDDWNLLQTEILFLRKSLKKSSPDTGNKSSLQNSVTAFGVIFCFGLIVYIGMALYEKFKIIQRAQYMENREGNVHYANINGDSVHI